MGLCNSIGDQRCCASSRTSGDGQALYVHARDGSAIAAHGASGRAVGSTRHIKVLRARWIRTANAEYIASTEIQRRDGYTDAPRYH